MFLTSTYNSSNNSIMWCAIAIAMPVIGGVDCIAIPAGYDYIRGGGATRVGNVRDTNMISG